VIDMSTGPVVPSRIRSADNTRMPVVASYAKYAYDVVLGWTTLTALYVAPFAVTGPWSTRRVPAASLRIAASSVGSIHRSATCPPGVLAPDEAPGMKVRVSPSTEYEVRAITTSVPSSPTTVACKKASPLPVPPLAASAVKTSRYFRPVAGSTSAPLGSSMSW